MSPGQEGPSPPPPSPPCLLSLLYPSRRDTSSGSDIYRRRHRMSALAHESRSPLRSRPKQVFATEINLAGDGICRPVNHSRFGWNVAGDGRLGRVKTEKAIQLLAFSRKERLIIGRLLIT